jgi:hypothetical protein
MRPSFNLTALHELRWYEFLLRFLFGGAITAVAGLIATKYGPIVGGLFLAFPAIFPASATLVEKHQRERKRKVGILDTKRGRQAAALDAYGTALGAVALFSFALIVWRLLPKMNWSLVLIFGTLVWTTVAVALWRLRKSPIWP